MKDTEDSCDLNAPTTTPVQPLPCDADDQSAPPTSPGKPEVDMRSASPAAGVDASPGGDTCDVPRSPTAAASEQEEEQAEDDMTRRLVPEVGDDVITAVSSSSYFGESHVTRLQSFVDSVSAGDEVMTSTTSWLRGGRSTMEPVTTSRPPAVTAASRMTCSDPRQTDVDEPLDLSLKPPARRPNSFSPVDQVSFPVPVMPPLFPLLACRESWIAHWAALAAASLQHSLLFPALAVTSQTGMDTTSGSGWMTSSSPHSSSSSSSPATDGRRTALTAMESFVQSSFKPRQQQRLLPPSSSHDLSHSSTNRKRRRHLGAEVTSSGDEDGGSHEEKRKRTDVTSYRTGSVKDASVSPRSDDLTSRRDDAADKKSPVTSLSRPEVNGEGGYLSCSTLYDGHDSTKEHPLVSLEKFVGVSAPLFRSSVAPPSAVVSNGISSPVCRTPALPDGKTGSDDSKMTSYGGDSEPEAVTSRSLRGDIVAGSLGRRFASAQSLLCCNL